VLDSHIISFCFDGSVNVDTLSLKATVVALDI
jgi:hypothetical protein